MEGEVDFCMNAYQKTAIFILRIAGCVLVVVGVMGLIYVIAAVRATGQGPNTDSSDRLVASLVWLGGGLVMLLLSKPIGRLLGRGLE